MNGNIFLRLCCTQNTAFLIHGVATTKRRNTCRNSPVQSSTLAALRDVPGIRDSVVPSTSGLKRSARGRHSCRTCLVATERAPVSGAGNLEHWIPPHKESICFSSAHPNRVYSLFQSLLNYMQMSKQNNTACPKLLIFISMYKNRW